MSLTDVYVTLADSCIVGRDYERLISSEWDQGTDDLKTEVMMFGELYALCFCKDSNHFFLWTCIDFDILSVLFTPFAVFYGALFMDYESFNTEETLMFWTRGMVVWMVVDL